MAKTSKRRAKGFSRPVPKARDPLGGRIKTRQRAAVAVSGETIAEARRRPGETTQDVAIRRLRAFRLSQEETLAGDAQEIAVLQEVQEKANEVRREFNLATQEELRRQQLQTSPSRRSATVSSEEVED